jgi:hypothetical protein
LGLDIVPVDADGGLLTQRLHFLHVGVLVLDLLQLLRDEFSFLVLLIVVDLRALLVALGCENGLGLRVGLWRSEWLCASLLDIPLCGFLESFTPS